MTYDEIQRLGTSQAGECRNRSIEEARAQSEGSAGYDAAVQNLQAASLPICSESRRGAAANGDTGGEGSLHRKDTEEPGRTHQAVRRLLGADAERGGGGGAGGVSTVQEAAWPKTAPREGLSCNTVLIAWRARRLCRLTGSWCLKYLGL
jgi:hypothetical protein